MKTSTRPRTRWRPRLAAVGCAALAVLGAVALPGRGTAATAAPTVRDGSTSVLAGASCWGIKQAVPAAASGVYWLQTPALVAPQRFYCDMTTDGGGWVLLGRGREGWSWRYDGQGTPAAVRDTPTGTAAFSPAALSGTTVDGLLNGTRVADLADGVRLRRATSAGGTTWQEARLRFTDRSRWSWQMPAGHLLSQVQVDGVAYPGGNTRDWNNLNGLRRIFTYKWQSHNWAAGWSFGSLVTAGANNATSYLWENANENHAVPFTQVFVRPMIANPAYPAIPDSGLPAVPVTGGATDATSPTTPWGVTSCIGGCTELNVEVEALGQVGDTMFVGGAFQYVQKGATPGPDEKVQQSYLAGFDVNTGEWRSAFRPVLNGVVWDIAAAPDGKLLVGGAFSSVNGEANTAGLAKLDPATGAVDPGFRASISTNAGDRVRALDVQGSWLYVGGGFSSVTGGNPATGLFGPVLVGNAARVDATTGRPDGTWKPQFNASIVELDASDQGDRVYYAGYFTAVNGVSPIESIAIVGTGAGSPLVTTTNFWRPSATTRYQQAIREVDGKIWLGGAEHDLQVYDRTTLANVEGYTTYQGGDYQAIGSADGVVYAACHCAETIYTHSYNWPNATPGWTQGDSVTFLAAFDSKTGQLIPDFQPNFDTRGGLGPWEIVADANGCVWAGGDMTRGSWHGTGYQWLGGFAKFCRKDTTPPTRPGSLTAVANAAGNALSWTASTDSAGSVTYEVLRDDRVIATTGGTSLVDAVGGSARYFVRAVDSAGNRSATTAAVSPQVTLVPAGSTWAYVYDETDLGTAWRADGYDDSSWARGPAEIGFGDGDEATALPVGAAPYPVTAYFRSTVTIADPAQYADYVARVVRDDGVVVYVNGVEVGRDNMPAGPITAATKSLAGMSTRAQETTPVDFPVPGSALRAGSNTIAVEVHQFDRSSIDLSFALQLLAR